LLSGRGGNDFILGGIGNDTLAGEAGADTFVFNFSNEGGDVVTDFIEGTDLIQISASGFGGGLTAGMDLTSIFGSSGDPTFGSATERFHFDTSTGMLWFDADGSDPGASVALAKFLNNNNLQQDDLLIV
jgi:Ca2+-binding RTX toxin-like protein